MKLKVEKDELDEWDEKWWSLNTVQYVFTHTETCYKPSITFSQDTMLQFWSLIYNKKREQQEVEFS